MAKRQRQKRIKKQEPTESLSVLYVSFSLFNDTDKDIQIRNTPNSYSDNPSVVKPLEQRSIFIKPGGFLKLWDCGKYFQLLAE